MSMQLAPVAVAQRAEPQDRGGQTERVADGHEVERRLRGVERLADVRQRDVGDRQVQVGDRGDEDQGEQHQLAAFGRGRLGPGGSLGRHGDSLPPRTIERREASRAPGAQRSARSGRSRWHPALPGSRARLRIAVATLGSMDLHVIGPLASPAERAAVDAVLGAPESGWVGGARDSRIDGHAAHGGHATRDRRSQLLPALHAVQSRIGWISQPALNYVCRRLAVAPAEAYGVATFYALFATTPRPPVVVHVCDDIACRLAGAERLCDDLARAVGPSGEPVRDGRARWLRSPCLGLCDRAPAAMVTSAGEAPLDARGRAGRRRRRGRTPGGRPSAGSVPTCRTAQARHHVRPADGQDRDRGPDLARRLPGTRRLRGAARGHSSWAPRASSPMSPPRS